MKSEERIEVEGVINRKLDALRAAIEKIPVRPREAVDTANALAEAWGEEEDGS